MEKLELTFEPRTIEHLGVKMYSTLPPALAELISNAYDADASEIEATFNEQNGNPISIVIKDNGCGMSLSDIQHKFLAIGRDRRKADGDKPSSKYGRLPTGKKGLGKLALFGIAKEIIIDTVKDGKRNRFILDWDALYSSQGKYNPKVEITDEVVSKQDGTSIQLKKLKRKTGFDIKSLADGLSKIFITDENFNIKLKRVEGVDSEEEVVSNERRFSQVDKQFSWSKEDLQLGDYKYASDIEFEFITSEKPIKPSSELRGITIFSRKKLVNAPEFFSDSTSSHVFQYLTGWIRADFIDLLDEDVISTNRQSLNWEHGEMQEFRVWLQDLVAQVGADWRKKRKEKKDGDFKEKTGIDKEKWMSTLPEEIKVSVQTIVSKLSDDEGVSESFNPVVKAVHALAPEYPYFHWRNLHKEIKSASQKGYENSNYYTAFLEAAKRYANRVREYSGIENDHDINLMAQAFGIEDDRWKVAIGYLRSNGTNFAKNTLSNIESAQRKLSQGIFEGGRNVVAHEEILDLSSSGLFSEKDCLDLLSLVSHLMCRVETANQRKNCANEKSTEGKQ